MMSYLIKKYPEFLFFRPFPYTLIVAVITSLLSFPGFVGPIISLPPRSGEFLWDSQLKSGVLWASSSILQSSGTIAQSGVKQLKTFRTKPIYSSLSFPEYVDRRRIVCNSPQLILQIVTMATPIPLGIMIPSLSLGACTGYLIGVLFNGIRMIAYLLCNERL